MANFIYDMDGLVIALVLLGLMLLAVEGGVRIGRGSTGRLGTHQLEQIGTIQTSLLGMLALLLGFTFSMALGRFDTRSDAVVDEANAIGTTWLRTSLLGGEAREEARALLRAYATVRIEAGALPMDQREQRQRLLARAEALQAQLWDNAARHATANPNPVSAGLYVQALNETIDAYGRRIAGLERHVPESVLLLLYGAFLGTGAIIGYASGVAGHRPARATYVMIVLIVMLMFMVMDMDRPQRGLIRVDQDSLLALRALVEGR